MISIIVPSPKRVLLVLSQDLKDKKMQIVPLVSNVTELELKYLHALNIGQKQKLDLELTTIISLKDVEMSFSAAEVESGSKRMLRSSAQMLLFLTYHLLELIIIYLMKIARPTKQIVTLISNAQDQWRGMRIIWMNICASLGQIVMELIHQFSHTSQSGVTLQVKH